MILRPTKSTRTYTLFPYTTRCRSLERRHHDQDADAADDEGGHPEKRLAAAARRHVGWIVEALARHGTRPRVERIEHRHGMPPFPASCGWAGMFSPVWSDRAAGGLFRPRRSALLRGATTRKSE